MDKRLIFKVSVWAAFITFGIFIGHTINWLKLSSTDPITITDRNIYLRDVDSSFVSKYGVSYEENYTYFLRGDIQKSIYRGNSFLTERTETDTLNVVLDKKIKKRSLKPIK